MNSLSAFRMRGKETRDIDLHSDGIEDFISYMEADIAEREKALCLKRNTR